MNTALDRREILKYGLVGALASVTPLLFSGSAQAASEPWRARFRNSHTGESFDGVYRVGGKYLPESFERINHVLRDHRSGEAFPMDPHVLDIMTMVHRKTGVRGPIEIFSGYRSPKTNSGLRGASSGVAKNSFHMYGQALDMHIDNYSTAKLRNIAKSIKAGGVGYYPGSKFVHVDTGAVRSWNG
jgi:uncharacterized protein YcbK (DUF882 family)